jgi:hypothetical protein
MLCLLITCLVGGASVPSLRELADAPPKSAGQLGFAYFLETPKAGLQLVGQPAPPDPKEHVYLFFINGMDPFRFANFRGQCQHMQSLGYANSYCGEMKDVRTIRQQILRIRQDDAKARIAVIGYSFGANLARTLANQLNDDGVTIDLLMYIGGDTIKNSPAGRPVNAGRVVNIKGHPSILLGYDLFLYGIEIDGAINHRINARHFQLPMHPEATELLMQYVAALNR